MRLEPDIVEALVRTIEMKDRVTAAHTWRVVMYARVMAERLKLDRDVVQRLSTAAALHDLGKIDIPDSVLCKPGPLTVDEYELMKRHTVLGYERLRSMGEDDELLLTVVRHHHERVDGTGYPDGLTADRLHLAARLFAVADSFDAMTSVRPYHAEYGTDAAPKAIRTLRAEAGTHYCPACVGEFAAAHAAGDLDWILMNFHDRADLPSYRSAETAQAMSEKLRAVAGRML